MVGNGKMVKYKLIRPPEEQAWAVTTKKWVCTVLTFFVFLSPPIEGMTKMML